METHNLSRAKATNNVYLQAISKAIEPEGIGYRLVVGYVILKNQGQDKLGKSYWRFIIETGEEFRAWDYGVALVVSGKGLYCFLIEVIQAETVTFNNVKAVVAIDADKFKFDRDTLLKLEIKE